MSKNIFNLGMEELKNINTDFLIKSNINYKLLEILNNIPMGIFYISLSGIFLDMNRKFCELLGYDYNELINTSYKKIIHPTDVNQNDPLYNSLLEGKINNYTIEKQYIKKDSRILWTNLTFSLIGNINDENPGLIGLFKISLKKKQELSIIELNKILKQIKKKC